MELQVLRTWAGIASKILNMGRSLAQVAAAAAAVLVSWVAILQTAASGKLSSISRNSLLRQFSNDREKWKCILVNVEIHGD